MSEIHYIEPQSTETLAQWRRVWIAAAVATVCATAQPFTTNDAVLVLLTGQPNAADNGPWLVRSDGSHERPA